MKQEILTALCNAETLLHQFLGQEENLETMEQVACMMTKIFRSEHKIIIFGNGGSACDAMHFAEEFTGRYRRERKPLPVIAIADPSHITCVANDYGFDHIFSRGVEAYAQPGDLVIGISTSGSSPNVIRAMEAAKAKQCQTFALLGKDGGALKDACDYRIIIPGTTSDRIQELHMTILHILIEMVERQLFPELY